MGLAAFLQFSIVIEGIVAVDFAEDGRQVRDDEGVRIAGAQELPAFFAQFGLVASFVNSEIER